MNQMDYPWPLGKPVNRPEPAVRWWPIAGRPGWFHDSEGVLPDKYIEPPKPVQPIIIPTTTEPVA